MSGCSSPYQRDERDELIEHLIDSLEDEEVELSAEELAHLIWPSPTPTSLSRVASCDEPRSYLIALLCRKFQGGTKMSVMYAGSAVGKMRR